MCRPIFVVGCPGSGTTLLYTMLESHSNINCGNETDFLVDLRSLVEGRYWHKLKEYDFDKDYWRKIIADMFNRFKEDYALKHGKQRWADKTPCYTPHIDFIHALFPNCQIIHVIRDGRDVVMSARRRWGYKSAIKLVYKWRNYIQSARNYGKTMPSDQYVEVRYEDLVAKPEDSAKQIFEYLREPWEPEVLRFDKTSSYNPKGGYERYTEEVRKREKASGFVYRSQVGTGKNLDPILKSIMHFSDGQLLKDLGYV